MIVRFNSSRLLLVAFFFTAYPLLTGCSSIRGARLYDVQSGSVLHATFKGTGNLGAKGLMRVELPTGEVCAGEYAATAEGTSSWGRIYFQGGSARFREVSSSNEWFGSAVAVGNQGTVFECEFRAMPLGPAHGACVDNRGRVFRLMFD